MSRDTIVAIVHMGLCTSDIRQWFGVAYAVSWIAMSDCLQWWHEESGSRACVLEEDGRVFVLLDKEALFIVVKYMYIQEFM